MKLSSPLRYPGGKSAIAGLLVGIRRLNGLGDRAIAEPFGGGAGASLTLLFLEETHRIFINDSDRAIYDLWWALTHRSHAFLDLLSRTRVSMAEWRRQRDVYRDKGAVSRLRRGFSAFYLNRCNRSGIIKDGGPIGGLSQLGKWRLNARFNKPELRRRCQKVAEYRDRIHVSCNDAIQFIKTLDSNTSFLFVDPPYFEKGPKLYLNTLDKGDHAVLAELLRSLQDCAWVATYDDCQEVRRMYRGWATLRPFSLRYTAARRRTGKELLITPKWMRLPSWQPSARLTW